MANVKLGDRTFKNTAVVRMNAPDGTVVDFYESNYYDIDVSDLGNIVENDSAFTQYDITKILSKTKFYQILEQRMIPRLLVFRDGGYIDIILLDRVTSTIYTNGSIDWIVDGDLGVLGEDEYTHFTIVVESSKVLLKCYRNDRKTQAEPVAPYYLIDLVTSIDRIFQTHSYNTTDTYVLEENEIVVPEIIQAISKNQEIQIKIWIDSYTQKQFAFTNIEKKRITAQETEYILTGFYDNGEKCAKLEFKNTESTARIVFSPIQAQGAVYTINGIYPNSKGDLEIPIGSSPYVIDLSNEISLDLSAQNKIINVDLSNKINLDELEEAEKNGRPIFLQMSDGGQATYKVQLDSLKAMSSQKIYTAIGGNFQNWTYCYFRLFINYQTEATEVLFSYQLNPMLEVVKTINGAIPDEHGNISIDIPAGTVKSVNSVIPDTQGNVSLNVGIKTVNNEAPDSNGNLNLDIDITDAVKSVNNITPDDNGNVSLNVGIKTVNNVMPDAQGNLNLEFLTTTNLSIDWTNGQIVQTFSDNSTRTSTIMFDENGVPTKIGDMTLNITGLGSEVGE